MSAGRGCEGLVMALALGDLEALAGLVSPEARVVTPGGVSRGPAGLRAWLAGRAERQGRGGEARGIVVEDGGAVGWELGLSGRFEGPAVWSAETVAGGAVAIEAVGAELWRLRDGLVVEYRWLRDPRELPGAMGLVRGEAPAWAA